MRTLNPDVAKVFKLSDRGMDLFKAWEKCGSPTTWGNVQRQYKLRNEASALIPEIARDTTAASEVS
jgi:hypothetical protein